MLFISFAKPRRSEPKGVVTAEKQRRIDSIGRVFLIRSIKIHKGFKALHKKRLDELRDSANAANALLGKRPVQYNPAFEKNLKFALLESTSRRLVLIKDLLGYAKAQKANPVQIKAIEKDINNTREMAVKIKEGQY